MKNYLRKANALNFLFSSRRSFTPPLSHFICTAA